MSSNPIWTKTKALENTLKERPKIFFIPVTFESDIETIEALLTFLTTSSTALCLFGRYNENCSGDA